MEVQAQSHHFPPNDFVGAPFAFVTDRDFEITATIQIRSFVMSGKTDQVKGRVKEAAGALTDNDRLRTEGQVDQAKGKVKETIEKVADKTKEAIDRATRK
jgi:uncharacterized protein YjbJ (UPF0337 family)